MSHDRGHRFQQVIGDEFVHENLLINPGFETWQRGAGPVSIAPNGRAFLADEWEATCGPSGGGTTSYRQSTSPHSGSIAADVNYTGTQVCNFMQGIEAARSLSGLWLTFSAWVKTTGMDVKVGIGDYTAGMEVVEVPHSGSGNWEQLTVRKLIRSGLTSSVVWPHDFPLIVYVYTTSAARFYVDSAMLVPGNFPEGVPFVPSNRADDWEKCQRFYETGSCFFGHAASPGPTATEFDVWLGFRVRKYTTPTLSDTFTSGGGSYAGSYLKNASPTAEGIGMGIGNISGDPAHGNSGGTYAWTAYIP